jgi:hypothetical protein
MNSNKVRNTQLHKDILYIIAEKLLAIIPDGGRFDFCEQNCYTLFMICYPQFAKFKRIEFSNGMEEQIKFYKNDNFTSLVGLFHIFKLNKYILGLFTTNKLWWALPCSKRNAGIHHRKWETRTPSRYN